MDGTLEAQIDQLDGALAAAEKEAQAVLGRLRGMRRRVGMGELSPVAEQIANLPGQIEAVGEAVAKAGAAVTYDAAAALSDGGYVEELKAEAQAQGLVLNDRDGRLTAFPLMLRLEPKQAGVRIGRKLEKGIRPSRLVKLLKQAQARARFDPVRSLQQMFKAYQRLAPAVQPDWRANKPGPGPIVALNDVYEMLTLHPAAAADYPREAFACDLLRLDKAPDTRTAAGHRFTLPASTGSKGRDRITVFDETGAEHAYVSIQFSLNQA